LQDNTQQSTLFARALSLKPLRAVLVSDIRSMALVAETNPAGWH